MGPGKRFLATLISIDFDDVIGMTDTFWTSESNVQMVNSQNY